MCLSVLLTCFSIAVCCLFEQIYDDDDDDDYSTGEWEMCCCTGGLAAETPDASDWQFALVVPISIGIKIDGGRKLNCLIA